MNVKIFSKPTLSALQLDQDKFDTLDSSEKVILYNYVARVDMLHSAILQASALRDIIHAGIPQYLIDGPDKRPVRGPSIADRNQVELDNHKNSKQDSISHITATLQDHLQFEFNSATSLCNLLMSYFFEFSEDKRAEAHVVYTNVERIGDMVNFYDWLDSDMPLPETVQDKFIEACQSMGALPPAEARMRYKKFYASASTLQLFKGMDEEMRNYLRSKAIEKFNNAVT